MNPDDVIAHILESLWDKPEVILSEAHIQRATKWAQDVYVDKIRRGERASDMGSFVRRETTGRYAEMAMEQLLGVEFVDWSIGDSACHNAPDLQPIGLRCGVKACSIMPDSSNVPLVPIFPSYPEVITVVRPSLTQVDVSICGVATREVMMRHSHVSLIRSSSVKSIGKKTGFHGFDHLIPFTSLTELRSVVG
jgi:hypothetical protein